MKNLMNVSTTDGDVWVDIAYIVTIRDHHSGGSVMTLQGGEVLMCTSDASKLAFACYETYDDDQIEYPLLVTVENMGDKHG
jgi:hypothetical protein